MAAIDAGKAPTPESSRRSAAVRVGDVLTRIALQVDLTLDEMAEESLPPHVRVALARLQPVSTLLSDLQADLAYLAD